MELLSQRLLHIHQCRGIGWKTIARFLQTDSSLESIYYMNLTELMMKFRMKKEHATLFFHDLQNIRKENVLHYYEKKSIIPITIVDERYPKLLKEIYDPPWVLYCKGDHTYLNNQQLISVVGTRYPSKNGLASLKTLLLPIIEKSWVIVSGLALGIDISAHQLAVENRGKTIAVLGSGFDHIYPKAHQLMVETLERDHLLISEYPPFVKPAKWHFPMRNRIISGLTKGTIVIEAREKSGSLITADQALQQGREVFAVPGSILEKRSVGTNQLIQQGAKLVLNSDDILTELNGQN
ncbi:DNA-processing protein DprA [Anaerobacillus sp. MEB173]|uniref:DNA-processing protein DprA n=1 Tax=Anaerobacillus sp. MEB173 TaxID=3383345 RepID=UPI003F938556